MLKLQIFKFSNFQIIFIAFIVTCFLAGCGLFKKGGPENKYLDKNTKPSEKLVKEYKKIIKSHAKENKRQQRREQRKRSVRVPRKMRG